MKDFKQEIANIISKVTNVNEQELITYIEIPKDVNMGDYAFPCFRLAKELKKAPNIIAEEIKQKLDITGTDIEKLEIAGGYLNFTISKLEFAKVTLEEINNKKEEYGKSNLGNGKRIVIDYSAPNIAKPFHIGHLRSTVIGGALYNIYKYLGYDVTGINHLGDYGTQFGKLIEGYKLWGKEYDIEKNPIDELTKIYIRINEACKEDEQILENCRNNFKKLEDGDEYCKKVWEKFRSLSLNEFKKVYDLLESKFDSWNGEAFYSDKMPEVIDILSKSGKLIKSQGAKIVDLEEKGINTPCIIEKSNGSTTYATRDLSAILYRARTYDFDKALYVTSYEQVLHFKQVFEVAKLLGLEEKYTKGLEHVAFGMVLLPTGKMSTREGNVIRLEELLNEAISKVKEIIEQKNPEFTEDEKQDIAKKVGIGAVIFNDLSGARIKDEVFDWDIMLNFSGETGPYIQYTYVRTNSVLKKVEEIPGIEKIDFGRLLGKEEQNILKLIYSFTNIIEQSSIKNEPSILARYLIDLSKAFSSFYNENKIIVEEESTKSARIYLTYATNIVLKNGARIIRNKYA